MNRNPISPKSFAYFIQEWRVDVPRETMLASLGHLDEKWQQFLRLAPPIISLWQLRALKPIQTWSKEKACIMGDAAHAMFQGMR